MPFIDEIVRYSSVSIVGMQKNTGKTVTFNYILKRLLERGIKVGVTSIGIDGESTDQVTGTQKPEIHLDSGVVFSTSITHYNGRQLVSEVIAMPNISTSLGDVVVSRVLQEGNVLLSGASDNAGIMKLIDVMHDSGAEIVQLGRASCRERVLRLV